MKKNNSGSSSSFADGLTEPYFPIRYKTTTNHNIKTGNLSDFVKFPYTVQIRGEINEENAANFAFQFNIAHSSGQEIIPIVIDSYGGDIYALMTMVDIIKTATVPVATICVGKAMSAGAVLLTCGHPGYRFASTNSTIMIHSARGEGGGGNVEEHKVNTKELIRLNKKILGIMSENCGHPKDFFEKVMGDKKFADWYLSSAEAKKYNIINEIKVPELNIDISARVTLK